MANLRTAMDTAFWDVNISTPQTIDGIARAVPGEPIPLDGTRASKVLRIQQLSFLGNGFPLSIIPCYSPAPDREEVGSFALQSLLGKVTFRKWWLGLVGQFRPKKFVNSFNSELRNIINEIRAADEFDLYLVKDVGKRFLDKSVFALGLFTQIPLTYSLSLLLSTETHGEREGNRTRAMLLHKRADHDISLEAAWPELFIDHKGKYWEVPESVSLDCSSLVSESGLRYRFGVHRNSGSPRAVDSSYSKPPLALMPGICAKAAFSYEKSIDLWRKWEMIEDIIEVTDKGQFLRPAYDVRFKEPHAAISGIIGGTCSAWFGDGKHMLGVGSREDRRDIVYSSDNSRSRFGVDLFGSACYTFQHGKFRELFKDMTRIDARLDINSATTLAKKFSNLFRGAPNNGAANLPPSLGLSLMFQQQVVGPIYFRADSKFSVDSSSGPRMEDLVCSLNYALRVLHAGKVVAWYSPKRKEAMIELQVFDF